MKTYLNTVIDEPMPTSTIFTHDENGEQIIRTDFLKTLQTSETDKNNLGLQVGRAMRGSIKVIHTPIGYGIKIRPFRSSREQSTIEPICTTTHGRAYRSARNTRVVFEFPSAMPLSEVASLLNAESAQICQHIDID